MSTRTEELLKYDAEHVLHSLGWGGKNLGFALESAKGVRVKDSEGKEYIDLSSQLINVNFGHSRRDIIEAAKAQLDKMQFTTLLRGFTNVPVIHLDIASPEGGFIDGVIGVNLFVDYNFVFNGNAFEVLDPPYIEFEPIPEPIIADIAPEGGDHKVDILDLLAFAKAWQSTEGTPNWNQKCDMAPQPTTDGKIDGLDFGVLFQHWLEGT